ncbi:MAG: PIG-L deacetylase family protein [Rhodoglobus sp.]
MFAHPDDESLSAGGLLARAASRGARTAVVTATWSRQTARGDELAAALRHLGAGEPRFLGYADARVPESAPGAPRLLDAPLDQAVERLVAIIREFRPEVVVTHDPYGAPTGHPDDVQTYRITTLAVEAAALELTYPAAGEPWRTTALMLATYPVSTLPLLDELVGHRRALFGTPDDSVTDVIDVTTWLDVKVAAILAHASEVERGAAPGIVNALSSADRARLLSTEWYIRRAPRA